MKRPSALLGVAAGLCMVAAFCLAQDPMALVQHAYELQQAGDYAGAADAYRAFLQLRPNEVGAHSNLGVVLSKLGRYNEAIAEYQAAEKLVPGDPRIGVNLALAYEKSGRIEAARDKLQQLHAAQPDDKQITMLLADCNLRLGENARVISLLEPLESRNPQDLAVAYMLGTALLREKKIDEGQRLVDIILKNGDTAESRFLLGSEMFAAGDYPSSVKQFASAISLNPNLPELQAYYGQSLLFTGDADGAGAAFRNELANDPNNFAANLGLAQILTQREQYSEALPFAAKAVLVRPGSAEAIIALDESGKRKRAPELNTKTSGPGPKVNELAPDFTLSALHSTAGVNLKHFRGSQPAVLIFGSYTCPNFRSAAPALDQLYAKYGQKAAFLLVYIREAHSSTNWQSTRNERDGVTERDASNLAEKQQHASICTRKLNLRFPAVVDGMDGKVEKEYAAWPSRAFVLDKNGRILYSTRLTELDFHADEMEACLRKGLLE
jgi:tetratricopeptide (TPR) repeat protein